MRERGPPAPAAINNKARYWSKVAIFAAVRRSRGHKFAITLGMEKLESLVYQMVKKIKNMFTRFDRIHERDRRTDGRTDRRTNGQTNGRMDKRRTVVKNIMSASASLVWRGDVTIA